MIRTDLVEAVIGLPAGVFSNTGVSSAIVFLRRDEGRRRQEVVFVDASRVLGKQGRRVVIRDADRSTIVDAVRTSAGAYEFANIARMEHIERNDWNLSVDLYVRQRPPTLALELDGRLDEIAEAEQQRDRAATRMDQALRSLRRFI